MERGLNYKHYYKIKLLHHFFKGKKIEYGKVLN